MAISGLRHTNNFVADGRPQNWREMIMLLYPNGKMPLTGLTSLMKSRAVDDPQFNWWEKVITDRRLRFNADHLASDTVLTVAAASGTSGGAFSVKKGDVLWYKETDEIMLVTADPTVDTQITVQRGFAGTTAAAIDYDGVGKDPHVFIIGSAFEEASNAPKGVNLDPSKKFNYTQIFRSTLEMSRTAKETRLRTGDHVREAKRECLEMIGMDIERAFWFGARSEGTLNGKPQRTMGGVMRYIDPGNIRVATNDHPGGVTMEGLEEYLYNIFKVGSSEKLAVLGNRAMLTIQQIVRKNSHFNIQSGLREYGMNVSRLTCPFGELVLKTHPLFNQMTGGTTGGTPYYGVESWMFVLDADELVYVYLKNSDLKYEPKLQENDLDGMKSGYIGELSLEIHHPTTHYLIKNLVQAAVDS